MDPEKLLFAINSGKKLVGSEINEVAALLEWIVTDEKMQKKVSADEIYEMILILGRAKAYEHRYLLKKYLDVQDSVTVCLALEILCLDWNGTAEHLEHVVNFALGVAWDVDEDVRHTALKILGEYLFAVFPPIAIGQKERKKDSSKESRGRELDVLELLLSIFDDAGEADSLTRQNAYYALCRAFGKDWEDIPSAYKLLSFEANSNDIDWQMIAYLRAQLSPGSSSNSSGMEA